MSELILFTSEDGVTQMHLRVDGGTIWLTQLEIAELFQTSKQNVSLHAKNILEEGELRQVSVVKDSLTTASDGKKYLTKLYNLDLILAIGYRVRSPRGTQFRQWATTHLREFLVKGFVMDDKRLKNPIGWDYFDELLARIREIRASEKRFYQKIRDLFALSSDYAADDSSTQVFFAEVQNKLHFAATGQTAAEIIVSRADPGQDNMSLTNWSGKAIQYRSYVGMLPTEELLECVKPPARGVGTEMEFLIERTRSFLQRIGLGWLLPPRAQCGCSDTRSFMNQQGISGCLRNRRQITTEILQRWSNHLPAIRFVPLARLLIGFYLKLAMRRFQKKEIAHG